MFQLSDFYCKGGKRECGELCALELLVWAEASVIFFRFQKSLSNCMGRCKTLSFWP